MIMYTFVGHASHTFDIDGKKVVVDPFYTSNPATDLDPAQVSADYIVLTHGHFDHIEDAVDIAKRTGAKTNCQFRNRELVAGTGRGRGEYAPTTLGRWIPT